MLVGHARNYNSAVSAFGSAYCQLPVAYSLSVSEGLAIPRGLSSVVFLMFALQAET